MTETEIKAWIDRLYAISGATRLDETHQALADAIADKVADDPDDAARLIAVLLQMDK